MQKSENKKEMSERNEGQAKELAVRPHEKYAIRDFDRIFDDFRREIDDMLWNPWGITPRLGRIRDDLREMTEARTPNVDIVDTGKEYRLTAELPGVSKDDVEVNLTDDGIELSTETKKETEEKSGEKDRFIRRERSYSRFYRSFAFPDEVVPEKADAKMENGVLEIVIPKKEVRENKRRLVVK